MTADQLRECPRFGDLFDNTAAGDKNPRKRAMFVRTLRRTGRLNPGVWWQMTDGNGDFWEQQPNHLVRVDNTSPAAVASHAEGEVALVTSCCGRSECGGECGNDWSGMVNPSDNHMPVMSDDDVERLSLQAGWEGNRKYMTVADFHIWCDRMRAFAALAHPPRSGDEARDAARYRWLRDLPRNYDGRKNGFHVTLAKAKDKPREWFIETMRGLDLDQAIDAAMAARGEEKETGL